MAVSSTLFHWEALKSFQKHLFEPLENVITSNESLNVDCAFLLTQSSKVFSTGKSSVGCLGLGEITETAEPVELKELSGVAGVSACGFYGDALAYTREGKLYVWGKNAKSTPCNRPQLVPELRDIVDGKCNRGHYLALTKSGKLYEWRGVNTYCHHLDSLCTNPKVVAINEQIMAIACGPVHSVALTKDGQVYSWGKKYINGYVDQPMTKISLPGETVAKVACGLTHSLVLTQSGKLYTWGDNYYSLGDSSGSTQSATPVEVGQNIGSFVDVAVDGRYTNAAVRNTGAVYMWGLGENEAKVETPTVTQCIEMHQVFANLRYSQYSWTFKSESSPASNMVVVDDSSSIAGKLKASFDDEETSDLTVFVDNKPIFVHKYVLKIRSTYFRTLLGERWTCRNKRELVLTSYSHDVFMIYFWFLYSGELTVSPDHLLELWGLSDEFGEDNLKLVVEQLMEKHLTMETVALLHLKALTKQEYLIKPEEEGLQGALDRLKKKFDKLQKIQKSLDKDRLKLQDQLHKIEEDCVLQLQQDILLQEKLRTLKLQVQQDLNGKHEQEEKLVQPEKRLQLDQENKHEQGQSKIEIHHLEEDIETLNKELAKLKGNYFKLKEELKNERKEDNGKLKDELKEEFKKLKALLLPQEGECSYSENNVEVKSKRKKRWKMLP